MTRRLAALAAALALAAPPLALGVEQRLSLLTANPAEDTQPAASPDGRWLVYVTEVDGAGDLRALRLDRRARGSGEAIRQTPGDESAPAFSPDGGHLAWTSTNEDALGDVLVMRWPGGTPRNLGRPGIAEFDPWWVQRDGRAYLRHWRQGADGARKVVEFTPGAWTPRVVPPEEHGEAEALPLVPLLRDGEAARRINRPGPAGEWTARIADDVDGNGVIDGRDDASLWRRDAQGRWLQATPPIPALAMPTAGPSGPFFSAAPLGHSEVATLSSAWDFAALDDPAVLLDWARAHWERAPALPFVAVAAARNAYLLDPEGAAGREALLFAAEVLLEAGRPEQALGHLEDALGGQWPDVLRREWTWRRALARTQSANRRDPGSDDARRERASAIAAIAAVRAEAPEPLAERLRLEEAGLLMQAGDAGAAAVLLEDPVADDAMDARRLAMRSRAALRLGFAAQARELALDAMRRAPESLDETEDAAEAFLDAAQDQARDLDARVLAWREGVAAAPDAPPVLRAAAALREGRALLAAGRPEPAQDAFRRGMALSAEQPRLAAQSAFALAAQLVAEEEFEAAIRVYDSVEAELRDRFFPRAPDFYRQAREGLIRESLAKGYFEFSLRDNPLAHATFADLLFREPDLVEGWRGLIEAQHRLGFLTDAQKRLYRRQAVRAGDNALEWYKAGLAATYESEARRIPRRALRDIERAIELDPSVPFFHQTRGFVLEAWGRSRGDREMLLDALSAYERALALLDGAQRPRDRAALMLNLGNVSMELRAHRRAAEFYDARRAAPVPFEDPRTEYLFLRNHGIALFRSSRPVEAAAAFQEAGFVLDVLFNYDLITAQQSFEMQTELLDRRALALMDAGQLRASADLFARVASRRAEDSLSRVRAERNRGFALLRLAEGLPREEARAARAEARESIESALERLGMRGLRDDRESARRGGLLGFDLTLAAGTEPGALLDVDPRAESRLLRAALARILLAQGERAQAIDLLAEELRLLPRPSDASEGYYATVRLSTLDTLAAEQWRLGDRAASVESLVEAIAAARVFRGETELVNGAGLSTVLLRLAECAIADASAAPSPDALAATWLGEGMPRRLDAMEALDFVLSEALARTIHLAPDSIIARPQDRARVHLARALANEQIAAAEADGPLAGIESAAAAARAMREAAEVLRLARAASVGGDAKRLAVLAHGARVRLLARHGQADEARAELAAARAFADLSGFGRLAWWLEAQQFFAPTAATRLDAAERALEAIEAALPGFLMDGPEAAPWPLLRALREAHLADALDAGDWAEAWGRESRWQAAALRFALDQSQPRPLDDRPEDTRWIAEGEPIRRALQAALRAQRTLPASADATAARARAAQESERWRAHLDDGLARWLPTPTMLAPQGEPAEVAAELATGLMLPRDGALVLVLGDRAAASTGPGFEELAAAGDWARLADRAGIWFVLGGDPPAAPDGVEVVRMGGFEQTFAAMASPVLGGLAEADLLAAPIATGAASVRFAEGFEPHGADAFAWRSLVESSPLGDWLAAAPAAQELEAPSTGRDWADAAIASAAARQGAASVRLDGRQWIGAVLPASEMRGLAEAELDEAASAATAAWQRGDALRTLAPAERYWRLLGLLESDPGERIEAGLFLAQVQRRLDRRAQAAATASEALGIARELGEDALLDQALSDFAAYASDAGDAASAVEALGELAGRQPDRRATHIGRAGVALENSGRYAEAIAAFREAAEAAPDNGEEALNLRRAGRVFLLFLNDYAAADEAFRASRQAALRAGDEALANAVDLDLARVDERLGLYNRAVDRAGAVEASARDAGDAVLRAEALLVLSFVEWARGNYFASLEAQAQARDLAEAADDRVLLAQAANQLGLVRWAVNDLEGAREALDEALGFAQGPLLLRDRASILNNRGLVERSDRRFADALRFFQQALAIDDQQENDWGRAYALRNIGIARTMDGRPRQAIEPIERAAALSEAIGDAANHAKSLLALAEARRLAGDPSADEYAEALAMARQLPLPEVEWRALSGQAQLALAAGDGVRARALLEESIGVIEGLRARIRIQDQQDGFLLDKLDVYNQLIGLQLDAGLEREALETSERSRGRNLLDLLGAQSVEVADASSNEALRRAAELRDRIDEAQARLGSAGLGTERTQAERELEELRRDRRRVLADLRAADPLAASLAEAPTIRVEELQGLLEPETRLVVYHVLSNEVVAWIVGPESFAASRTRVDAGDLSSAIAQFRSELQSFGELGPARTRLSEWITQPLRPHLPAEVVRIGVAPHRELHQVPFAALDLGREPLIARMGVFHTPSASVLRHTMERRARIADAGSPRVLALGNPDLGNPAFSLPFAEKEVERLEWSFPEAEILTGARATAARFVAEAPSFQIVHIASHGEFDPDDPMFSGLELADDPARSGRVTARDIFPLPLGADLVALSACQTGLGRLSNGDDVVGLNMAFLHAGARQVLSTLWRVDDVSTALLVKHFYRNAPEADRAEALRRAQLAVRERQPHPAHWAGMQITGDWQ